MYSLKITKIVLKNFIGIKYGLGKSELTIDFSKILDKNIICILGDNGTGKTTLSSVLHPLPGTTDKRSKFILEDKEGLKKIYYERSDGCEYECKLVYTPSKTGHNTKGFVKKKTRNGEEVELNPNGNITSYKDIIFDELGVNDAILKLANQNDICKGHVDMTSTERKVNMSTFLPEDIYSAHFAVVDKIYKEMKTRINVLVDAIGKMHDDETIKRELEKVTDKINHLVNKRDECIGKIKELETRIDIFEKDGIVEKEKSLLKEMKSNNKELESLSYKMMTIYQQGLQKYIDEDMSQSKIQKTIDTLRDSIQTNEINVGVFMTTINELKNTRNNIMSNIENRKEILQDINTDYSLNELESMLDTYKKRYKELDKQLSTLDTNLHKEDFMIGYEIIAAIRRSIDSICEFDNDYVEYVSSNDNIADELSKLDDIIIKRNDLMNEKDYLHKSIANLNKDAELKEILNKRPHECKIDDCPFIKNAQKWTLIEKEIIKFSDEIDKIDKKLDKYDKTIEELKTKGRIYELINNLWKYVESNLPVINKLPYHEKYSTYDAIRKAVYKKGANLSKCDDFEKFIDILESNDEFIDLKYKKIPTVENEINILKTNGMLITNSKNELKELNSQYDSIINKIDDNEERLSELQNIVKNQKDVLEKLTKFLSLKTQYDDIYDDLLVIKDQISETRTKIEKLEKYQEKHIKKKHDLRDIDDALNPLTRERELYKMEQLKVADHKQELAAIEADMYKCEIVRSSLSIKDDGIPVSALEYFMDTVRSNANALLSGAFNGSLYLEEFIINSKDFIIPYKKNGDRGMDVSFASSSERSFISLCLTLAIMEEIVSSYGIAILDEIDRGFSSDSKYKFIEILGSQVKRVGITQVFMVTHNSAFYEGYNIGYILFPGADISKVDDDDCIRIEKS